MRATLILAGCLLVSSAVGLPSGHQDDEEIAALIAAERQEAELLRRRGKYRQARSLLQDLLEEEEGDAETRSVLARVYLDQARYDRAREHGLLALEDAKAAGDLAVTAECARTVSRIHLVLGEYEQAIRVLEAEGHGIEPEGDARDAWLLGNALSENGDREAADRVFALGQEVPREASWQELLAGGRCLWARGRLTEASRAFVTADRASRQDEGTEPDVLAALGALYFESEREVEAPGKRSAADLFKEALELHPTHEASVIGLFELHRYNRRRQSRSPEEVLEDLIAVHPDSIAGLLAKTSGDLTDGRLRAVRESLAKLEELAPGRRERFTLAAALAWVEHRREDCEAILADLLKNAAADSRPEREVGRHLTELYRFQESLDFLRRAVERDPTDFEAWTYYARSLANTGDENAARDALQKAKQAAAGRQDAWRNNMDLVLRRMSKEQITESFGELSFSWAPDAREVLLTYFLPFYEDARVELAERYGHTPGPTLIEVFRRHEDFSVRSVGFAGFPALGVCFGSVVTALSPLSEMRGQFSWARTGFHEFSHVVHLGLSHNRCPRWITEGLATWEEVNKNPAWTRNMRRDLLDAYAQNDLIKLRDLNRAFRGPRILFGYYQGGLLCQMLIEQHGFPPMIHFLEAFDAGLDLDQACMEVFQATPEDIDARFKAWVEQHLDGLELEPRWGRRQISRLRISLKKEPPTAAGEKDRWVEDWVTVAWGSWQQGRKIDAEEALRLADLAEVPSARGLVLRGLIALDRENLGRAKKFLLEAVELGARDYRGLMALGRLHGMASQYEKAEEVYLLAEDSWPGFDDPDFSAELSLAELYNQLGRDDDRMEAIESWLMWNPGNYEYRIEVATWHAKSERPARAEKLFAEANEIDPFRRDLHRAWGDALMALERYEEAEREYRVTQAVPPDLDFDHLRYVGPMDELPLGMDPDNVPVGILRGMPDEYVGSTPLSKEESRELLDLRIRCLEELGQEEQAAVLRKEAEALSDGD